MYKVIENANYSHLKKKICELYGSGQCTESIGCNHKTYKFDLSHSDTIDITYKRVQSDETFVIPIILTPLKYTIDINKQNRYYDAYMRSQWRSDVKTTIIDESVTLFGVRICDLIRHYVNTVTHDFSYDGDNFQKRNNFEKSINKCFDKIMCSDLSKVSSKEIFGMIDYKYHTIHIWSDLMKQKNISGISRVFTDYFQKIIYFSNMTMFDFMRRKYDAGEFIEFIVNDVHFLKLLNGISNKEIVTKIMKHYFFNEDPSIDSRVNEYLFDPPVRIQDVLLMLYDINHSSGHIFLYHQLIKKLNMHQQRILDEKYHDIVFDSVKCIPATYPFYALQNIFICKWSVGYDFEMVNAFYRRYMNGVQMYRLKYKFGKVNKMWSDEDFYGGGDIFSGIIHEQLK